MSAILYKGKVYGVGGSIIEGYYKVADGKFYEESTYETEILGAEDLLYIDLTSKMQFIFENNAFVNITEDAKPTVTEASSRTNIASGDTLKTIIGKIKKFFSDLKDLAFIAIDGAGSTKYLRGDGTWQTFPTIPTVNNGTLTIKRNNTSVGTFTANQSTASNINIECATPSDIAGSKTASGSVVTVTDAADIYAEQVDVAVVATQSGSGTPSPSNIRAIQSYDIVSVDRCGKNLFDVDRQAGTPNPTTFDNRTTRVMDTSHYYVGISFDNYFTASNATCSISNGTVTVTSLNSGYGVGFPVEIEPSTNYSVSATLTNTSIRTGFYDSDWNYISYTSSATFTTPSNAKYADVVIYGTSVNVSGTAKNIQLEEGQTATTYEPYNGQTITCQLGNKNLLPMTVEGIKANNTGYTWNGNSCTVNGGTFTINTDKNGDVINVKANGTFSAQTFLYLIGSASANGTIDGLKVGQQCIFSGGVSEYSVIRIFSLTSGGDFNVSASSFTKTISSNSGKVAIRIDGGQSLTNALFYPMIRDAAILDATFSPYNPTLGGMVYGGQLTLKDDGSAVFVGDKGYYQFNGSETYSNIDTGWSNVYRINTTAIDENLKVNSASESIGSITTPFSNIPVDERSNNVFHYIGSGTYRFSFAIGTNVISGTKQSAVDWITANKPSICYPLATPFTIHLSAEQLQLLQGTNNVWSNAGDVTLKYQPDNVIGEAIGVCEAYTEKYVQKFHSKNIIPMTVEGIKAINGNASSWSGNTFNSGSMSFTLLTNDGVNVIGIIIKNTTASPGADSFLRLIPDGRYMTEFSGCILSGCSLNNENVGYIAIRGLSGGYKYYAKNTVGDSVIDDIPDDIMCQCYVIANKDTVFETIIYPMIRKPDTDNAFVIAQPTNKTLLNMIADLSRRVSALE